MEFVFYELITKLERKNDIVRQNFKVYFCFGSFGAGGGAVQLSGHTFEK